MKKSVKSTKPAHPWQHLLDLKKQHQTPQRITGKQPMGSMPRFVSKTRSGSR